MHRHRHSARRIATLAAAGMLFLAPAGAATTATAARLLVADKDGRALFLLPETHVGTPAQQDRYFKDTIRPAFAAASALLVERGASARFSRDYYRRGCDDPEPDEPELDAALNATLRAHPDRVLERFMPADDKLGQLGRFIRFEMLVQTWASMGHVRPGDAVDPTHVVRALPPQSGQLMRDKPHPWHSVDDTGTIFQAYCALAPAERSALVRTMIDDVNAPPRTEAETKGGLSAIYRDLDAAYRSSLAAMRAALRPPSAPDAGQPGPAPDDGHWTAAALIRQRFLITERNRTWIAQLPSVLATERLPFYAIGAAHFADGSYGPGLVTLLHQAGYRVRLVDGPQALRAVLARVPAHAGKAEEPAALEKDSRVLAGKCVRVPHNYLCAWGDGTTQYDAYAPTPSSPLEVVIVCYRRRAAYGPLNQCVNATVPRPPQRDGDLATAHDMTAE